MKRMTLQDHVNGLHAAAPSPAEKQQYDSACAAAGQLELMSFYTTLFQQCGQQASQILVVRDDFSDEKRTQNIQHAMNRAVGGARIVGRAVMMH